MKLRTIKQIKNLKNKKVLLRVDFNVPISARGGSASGRKNGRVIDDSRIRAALPTIKYLVKRGAKIILISHLGKPLKHKNIKTQEHKNIKNKKQYSLEPVYKNLKSQILNLKFIDDCIGKKVKKAIGDMKPGEVILLENLRFYKGEEYNDAEFAKKLAELADVYPAPFGDSASHPEKYIAKRCGVYINDAFGCSHRAHASVVAVTKYLPSYAGFLLENEVKNLSQVLDKPKHPFVMVMGGVKISTKIPVIKNLIKKADYILVGGALASNFLKAAGYEIGESIYEPEMLGVVKKLLKNKKIILPVDVRVKLKIKNKKSKITIKNLGLGELNSIIRNSFKFVIRRKTLREAHMFEILDIGPKTIELFSKYLKSAKMIVWNGPLGYFEKKPFDQGTRKIAEVILSNKKARIIIGGGETVTAINQITKQLNNQATNLFISTGGGAMLEFLGGDQLPGIKPLIK